MNKWENLITIGFWVVVLAFFVYFITKPHPKVSQSYWYCWDSGTPRPHHLGHHVAGDHLCTDAELGK